MANTLKFGNGEWYGEKDTILAYNDENSNYKPLPFDFSRASSATRVNKAGLIETVGSGEPRIDFKDDTKGALKLEPTRTNSVTYSNGFTDSSWLPTGATVVSGVISPDGTSNAFTLSNTASSGIIQKAVSLTGLRVVSIFAKKGTHRYLRIGAYGGTNSYANFDLENGVVADGANANIEDYGNGWFRCICHSADGTTGGVQIFPSNNSVGAATTNGSIQIYGVQLEQGSYATSYIPTSGSAVTRVAESSSQTPPSGVIGQTEGAMYAELGSIPSEAIDDVFVELSDGTSNNRILFYADSNGYIRNQIKASGSISSLINTNVTVSSNMKIAITYKSNEAKVFINGVQYGGTDTSVVVPSVNKMNLENYTGARSQTSTLKDVKLYNTVLTDQELIALTQV